jgi:hypothetical protein
VTAWPTIILSSQTDRQRAADWVARAPQSTIVSFRKPTRTLLQNARLHALCTDVARQVDWPRGSGVKRDVEAWKDIFTAALLSANHGLDVVPGINGGFVLLGMHTSAMKVDEVNDLMTLIEAWGAENEVEFSAPAEAAA